MRSTPPQSEATSILDARATPARRHRDTSGCSTRRSLLQTTNATHLIFTVLLGRGRRDLAARRRHRRHEHHARHRHRAHPRDRDPQGDRRAQGRHPRPVPDRGRAALAARRRAGVPPGWSAAGSRSSASSRSSSSTRSPSRSGSASPSACSSASIPRTGPRRCGRSKPSATSRRTHGRRQHIQKHRP